MAEASTKLQNADAEAVKAGTEAHNRTKASGRLFFYVFGVVVLGSIFTWRLMEYVPATEVERTSTKASVESACSDVMSDKTLECMASVECTNWFKPGEDVKLGSGKNFCFDPAPALEPFVEGYNYKIEDGWVFYRFCAKSGTVKVSYRLVQGACPARLPT